MKAKLCLALLIFVFFSASSTVHVVDNNGNAPAGVFTSISTAMTSASDGDTLLITPSSSTYGNVSITKPLVFIGVGFNPDMEIPFTSKVGQVTIRNTASNTKLIGLEFTSALTLGNTSGTLSNLVIENNKLQYITHSGITSLVNVLIRQNVLINSIAFNTPSITLSVANQSNIRIINNIFSFTSTSTAWFGPSITTGGATFDHNLFLGTASQNAFRQLVNCLVTNNIFVTSPVGASLGFTNITFKNNLSTGTDFSALSGTNLTTSGNFSNTSPTFVDLPLSTVTYTFDLDAELDTGSSGENAATDGSNLGVFGGDSPFKKSGSVLPVVRKFTIPSNVVQGQNIDAEIEVTGN